MLSDVTFGQYYPSSSFVHRLDPRTKILLLIAYIVMIFMAQNFYGLAAALVFLAVTVVAAKLPPLSVLRSLKGIIFLLLFTFILNVFFYTPQEGDTVYFWNVSKNGLISACFLGSRLLLLVIGSSILTLTTTPVSLTDGIESIAKVLTLGLVNVHTFALIMSIALRMIPTLSDETDRIMRAQKARGSDFESGNLISRVKSLIPVLLPLLVSSFRRADELGDAMDARCYSGSKIRTKFKKLRFGIRDLVSIIVTAFFITAIVFLNISGWQITSFLFA